jgi:hypothetical protein
MVAVTPPGEVFTVTEALGIAAPDLAEVTTSVYFCIYCFDLDPLAPLDQKECVMVSLLFIACISAVLALVLFGIKWYAESSLSDTEKLSKYDGENHVR